MRPSYAPGACSLADRIPSHETGLPFGHGKVDLKTRGTESGADLMTVNPEDYGPPLTLESGETPTETVAILDRIAHQDAKLAPSGPMAHTHLLEAPAFIATEIHENFKPLLAGCASRLLRH